MSYWGWYRAYRVGKHLSGRYYGPYEDYDYEREDGSYDPLTSIPPAPQQVGTDSFTQKPAVQNTVGCLSGCCGGCCFTTLAGWGVVLTGCVYGVVKVICFVVH